MQEILRRARARERPVGFLPPLVPAHHEDPYRLARELVLHAFKQVVVPGERDVGLFLLGGRAEIHVADLAPAAGVTSDGDQEALAGARRFVRAMALYAQ